jgi:putative hydrolase of the HAD superfamily
MVLVFDLDDTLYDEISYMRSGFRAVSQFLSKKVNLPADSIYKELLKIERVNGRGKVFDIFLRTSNFYSRKLVSQCVSTYRLHKPIITLKRDAINCIKRFADLPIYIVTDGNKIVQRNKIRALKVDRLVKKVYITHRYGIKHSKPSPFCFLDIARREQVDPARIFYIGDNPSKDFVGIKPHGFRTIRIVQGTHRNVKVSKDFDAIYRIKSLNELKHNLLLKLL